MAAAGVAVVMALVVACSSSSGSGGSTGASAPASGSATGTDSTGTTRGTAPAARRPAEGARPTVSGPVTGGAKGHPSATAPTALLADAGYVEEELLLTGEATSYQPDGTWTTDGMWRAKPAGTAPYTTRVLVRRPTDPAKFNGVVLVEWLNVSIGADVAVDFGYLNRELLDQGYIYVGVSAQKVGVEASKTSDPERYGGLNHPGDEYSYDMFTQAGRAVLANQVFAPGYSVHEMIADGESQSAGRMTTYINAIQPITDLYDGFFVHSRGDRMTPVARDQPPVPGAHIRTDQRAPTLVVLTETDVLGNLGNRQDDSDRYRRWEIAGSAHVDNYDLSILAGTDPSQPSGIAAGCALPINTAHQYWVLNAGLRHLKEWSAGGSPPPTAERMTVGADNKYVLDGNGNTTGGIRLPDIDVPVATQSGLGNSPSFCGLYGTTTTFDAAKVASLYPTHDDYARAFLGSVDRLARSGFMLDREVNDAKSYVDKSPVGR